jgi:hypothetical protein
VISDFRVMGDQWELFGQVASVPTARRALREAAACGDRGQRIAVLQRALPHGQLRRIGIGLHGRRGLPRGLGAEPPSGRPGGGKVRDAPCRARETGNLRRADGRRVACRPPCGTFRAIGRFHPVGRPARSARVVVA